MKKYTSDISALYESTESDKLKNLKDDIMRTVNQEIALPDFRDGHESSSRPKDMLEILKGLDEIIDQYAKRTPNGLELK